ncbi:MAG: WYL domain-containing protein [Clostridia bacterium]|nr:WYL domain-containing protein [Clostridia bacterium]
MPKSANQKLKLLYLMRILLEKTDENHQMTVAEMIQELSSFGISAERKSIYDDLEALRLFGLDVEQVRSAGTGYYVANRDFELPEVKLLVDSVQSSKFITQKKTMALIKKIEKLASVHEAKQLHRQVFVQNRVKSMNESVYYNVDKVSAGIAENKKIRFKYFNYTVKKEKEFRHDGKEYEVSPFAMLWDDENYYLVAYDSAVSSIRHYRVDKMTSIFVSAENREGQDVFKGLDFSAYCKKVFGMYAGREQTIRLSCKSSLAGVIIDRFGKDLPICIVDEDHFLINITVGISPQFFAWVFGLGEDIKILAPDNVVAAYKEQLARVEGVYLE